MPPLVIESPVMVFDFAIALHTREHLDGYWISAIDQPSSLPVKAVLQGDLVPRQGEHPLLVTPWGSLEGATKLVRPAYAHPVPLVFVSALDVVDFVSSLVDYFRPV